MQLDRPMIERGNVDLSEDVSVYFQRMLDTLADSAPSDACVRGRVLGEGKGFAAQIDVAATTLKVHAKEFSMNPIVAIDLAAGEVRDRILDWRHSKERLFI